MAKIKHLRVAREKLLANCRIFGVGSKAAMVRDAKERRKSAAGAYVNVLVLKRAKVSDEALLNMRAAFENKNDPPQQWIRGRRGTHVLLACRRRK